MNKIKQSPSYKPSSKISNLQVQRGQFQENSPTYINMKRLPITALPVTQLDKLYGNVSRETGGSLMFGKNKYAGTTGGSNLLDKIRKIL